MSRCTVVNIIMYRRCQDPRFDDGVRPDHQGRQARDLGAVREALCQDPRPVLRRHVQPREAVRRTHV